jgi:hypothetical protein
MSYMEKKGNKDMKTFTDEQARRKKCPMMSSQEYFQHCQGEDCMLWVEVHGRVEREDHSGAPEHMSKLCLDRGISYSEIKREGPCGSYGRLVIEARGVCSLAAR